jgi:outer membrane protein assembly factor BamB
MLMKKKIFAPLAIICVLLSIATFSTVALVSEPGSASEDWPMYRHDPSHTGYTTAAGPTTPNVLWNFSTSGNPVDSSPAVVDGKLYVGSENGNIYCLDVQTGRQIWVNFTNTSPIRSSPAVSNGFLYVCDENGLLYCLDAQTGEVNWTFSMGAGGSSSPTVADGYVYFSSSSEYLYCLDASTGRAVWSFYITRLEPSIEGTEWSEASRASASTSPAIVDGRVYVGGSNLYCLDAGSGSLIWSYPIVVACAPTVSEEKVYFSSWAGNAYCLDADTGEKVWNQSNIVGWSRSGPSVADGRVYFGGLIYCLNASNGKEIWHYSTGDISADSAPIVAGEYAYFGTSHGGYENICTYCVNAATGEYVWKSAPPFSSSPAVVDGVLYVSGGDSIVAFSDSLRIPMPVLVMVFTVVAICTVVGLAYVANREGTVPSARWKRVFNVPVTVILILVILASSFASLYGSRSAGKPSPPEFTPVNAFLWQNDLEYSATSMAAGDGKVFITIWKGSYNYASLGEGTSAYSAQDGQLVWSSGVGSSRAQVYEGGVYVAKSGSVAFRLDENTGKVTQSYQAPAHYNGWKFLPDFTLGDGKIFVDGTDGDAVYDVDSGGLYWEYERSWSVNLTSFPERTTLGELGTPEINRFGYVFIGGNSRIDLNNGVKLWGVEGWAEGNLVVDDRVVFWNYPSPDHPILCVDALLGQPLWDFELGASVYEPVAYGGLLVFGASDGYLYALNLADGSLAWKILVDVDGWIGGNNLPAEAKSLSDPSVSSVVVDDETGLGVWGFTVTQRDVDGINGNNLYVGRFCSFDVSKGTVLSTYTVESSCDLSDNGMGLAPGRDVFYLTAGLDVWSVDKASGEATMLQRYERSLSKPLLNDGTIFIAADLYLSAYR